MDWKPLVLFVLLLLLAGPLEMAAAQMPMEIAFTGQGLLSQGSTPVAETRPLDGTALGSAEKDAGLHALHQPAPTVRGKGQIGGLSYAVAISGTLAYAGVGPRLVILEISDPTQPAFLGQTGVLPGVVRGVAAAGDYAYVAAGSAGLRIIQVHDPSSPREVGFYSEPGYAQSVAVGVAVAGNYAYVADGIEACLS